MNPLLRPKQAMPLTPEAQKRFKVTGDRVLDEVQVGDYELFLTVDSRYGFHQIGLQRRGHDFTSEEQQAEHIIPKGWGNFDRKAFKEAITRWLAQYHMLVVASHSSIKTKMYGLALRAIGFKLTPVPSTGLFSYIGDGKEDPRKIKMLEQIGQFMEQMQNPPEEEPEEEY